MVSMKELFALAKAQMEEKKDFVFVTTIASSGSSPRGAGSRMLVLSDGTPYGTIGGGSVEYAAILQAKEVLEKKASLSKGYKLRKSQVADLGMICGGDVVVYFQYITPDNQDFYEICCQALTDWDKNMDSWLILDITDETAWSAGYFTPEKGLFGLDLTVTDELLLPKAVQVEIGNRKYYSEPLIRKGVVYVFGGGHVAQELVPLLTHLDFRCVVFDDREQFANKEVFPTASQCIVGDFDNIFEKVDIQAPDYVCIMTRGHQFDCDVQNQVLHTDAHYIGVMGSRKKMAAVRAKLKEAGHSDETIDRITTPIGLEILAETPAEIAVCIAGQLIHLRAKQQSWRV